MSPFTLVFFAFGLAFGLLLSYDRRERGVGTFPSLTPRQYRLFLSAIGALAVAVTFQLVLLFFSVRFTAPDHTLVPFCVGIVWALAVRRLFIGLPTLLRRWLSRNGNPEANRTAK